MNDVGAEIQHSSLYRLAKQRLAQQGIDVNDLPTKEELDHQTIDKARQALKMQKIRKYYAASLWSGNIKLKFTFDQWQPELQDNVEQAKQLGNQAYKLATQLKTQNFNVVMLGTPGVGKTSLALAMLDYLMINGRSVMFVSTAELLRLVNEKFNDRSLIGKISEIKRAMTEVDVLLLDDFGTEGGQKFNPVHSDMQQLLYQVANARVDFDHNKALGSTIITTNNTKPQLKMMYEPKFVDRVFPNETEHQLIFADMKGVRSV